MVQTVTSKYTIKTSDWLLLAGTILAIVFMYVVSQNKPLKILLIGPKNMEECLYLVKDAKTEAGARAMIQFCKKGL